MDKAIYTTSNYSIFKKLPGNRDTKCVGKIIKSINEVGYILCPILVNENMEIIDGQNRFEALMELEMPIDYIIQPGLGLKECRNMNIGRGNWTTGDYIKSFAEEGNENYQRLMILLAEFQRQYAVEGVLYFAKTEFIPHQGGANFKKIKEGRLSLNEDGFKTAKARLSSAKALGFTDFKDENEMLGRPYWGAVSYAYAHEDISVKELIARMNENPKLITPCGRVVEQLSYFDEAYNRRRLAKNKVFMSSDFQQRKFIEEEEL